VQTAQQGGAAVGRTDVAVIAVQNVWGNALRPFTSISNRAGISIIALTISGSMQAPLAGVTDVRRTGVAIVTQQLFTRNTLPSRTVVAYSTNIKVTAEIIIGEVGTAGRTITTIVSARILVVAKRCHAATANPFLAKLSNSAGIAVITSEAIVIRHY